jgi:tetratricopeptide (TPR) repeat protein
MGRFAEAREQIQAARRIDPGSANLEGSMIWVNNLSRQYDEAITQCKEAIERNPNFYAPYQQLGQAYVAKQMYGPAIAALQKARIFSGNAAFAMARLGQAYALAGNRKEAKELLNELRQSNAQPQYIAWVYIGLGDSDRAFQWLERAFDYRSGDLIYLKTDSIYDRLSRESRFTDLLRRIGFQP